jgi:V/A-type H+/Na+-transporting ATPase subunit D
MDPNTVPTKGNLIKIKNSLALAIQGYELMDKKRNILIRELLELVEKAKNIQSEIDVTFSEAYLALQKANIEMGIRNVEDLSSTVPEENSIAIKQRSIMGTDIPLVEFNESDYKPAYSFYDTRISLDEATNRFKKSKRAYPKVSHD